MSTASTNPPSLTPTSSAFRPVLLYDKNAPATVVASVATAMPPADGFSGPADYIEFHVTCASPCPADFPPQTVTQKSGSIWGGHHAVSGTTTAWDCILGTHKDDVNDFGDCYTTTLSSDQPVPTSGSYTQVGTCQVFARSKLMFVTAGFDEYFKVMPTETTAPIDYESAVTSVLRSAGCPSSAFPTPAIAAESKPTTAASTKASSATESKPTANPTGGKSEAAGISRGFTLLLSMTAFAMALHW